MSYHGVRRRRKSDDFKVFVALHYCECSHHFDVHTDGVECTAKGCNCKCYRMRRS